MRMNRLSKLMLGAATAAGVMGLLPAIATAPTPPQLVQAKLNGQPISVLYMTRSGDRVLVRCYPGFQPNIAIQTRADGVKEGVLTCGQ